MCIFFCIYPCLSHSFSKSCFKQYKQWQEEQNKQFRASGKSLVYSRKLAFYSSTQSINETMQCGIAWLVQRRCGPFCQQIASFVLILSYIILYCTKPDTLSTYGRRLSHNFSWSRSLAALPFDWSKMVTVFPGYGCAFFFACLAGRRRGLIQKWAEGIERLQALCRHGTSLHYNTHRYTSMWLQLSIVQTSLEKQSYEYVRTPFGFYTRSPSSTRIGSLGM